MTIELTIAGRHVIFTRDWFTGSAKLSVDGLEVILQNPLNPATHFSLTLKESWVAYVGERVLLIEKTRPLIFAGFRPQTYRLFVDGAIVTERRGY